MIARRAGALAWLLLLGLLIRALLVGYDGMEDIGVYREWGTSTHEHGLARAFQGIYFPVQYLLFALVAALSAKLGGTFVLWLKLLHLAFDCGVMAVLWRAAAEPRKRMYVCLMYWLNPWFLALFALGYCDFQIGFFVLTFLYLFREDGSVKRSLLAGVPLAIAFLMKPQAMGVVLMMAFIGVFLVATRRKAAVALTATMVPAVLLFAAFSLWFATHGRGATSLARTYLHTSSVMPSLTANMLNIWHPICTFLAPDGPIWGMRDDVALWPGISFRRAALVATLVLQFAYAGVAVLRRPGGYALASAITFAALVVPLVMSGAHENHLYLGTLGLVLLAASGSLPRLGFVLFALVSLLATTNLVGHYGLGRNPLSDHALIHAIEQLWSHVAVLAVAAAAMVVTFVLAVAHFFRDAAGDERLCSSRWSRVPVLALVAFLVAVYSTVFIRRESLRALPRLGALTIERNQA